MILLVKTPATTPEDLSSIPQTHRVEEESGFPQIISSDFDTNTQTHTHAYIHMWTYKMNFILHMFASVGSFTFYGLFLLYDALFISVQLILLNSYNWVHQIIYCNVFDFSSFNRQLFNIFPLYIVLWCLFLSSVWILIPANYLKIDIFCL